MPQLRQNLTKQNDLSLQGVRPIQLPSNSTHGPDPSVAVGALPVLSREHPEVPEAERVQEDDPKGWLPGGGLRESDVWRLRHPLWL